MATAEQLLVRIDATTEQLRRELSRGDQAIGGFAAKVDSRLAGMDKSFANVGAGLSRINGLLGALGVGIGVAALANLGRSAIALGDEIGDTAAQLGLSTDALQIFRFAAAETGVKATELDQAIIKLNATIGEAASGDDAAVKKFKGLGISFEDAAGNARSAEAVLDDLADLVKSLPTAAERAAAAAELLGLRAGPKLVPLLADGAAGLDNFGEAARDAGQIMEKETIAAMDRAQRAIEKFNVGMTIAVGNVLEFLSNLPETARGSGVFQGLLKDELAGVDEEIARIQESLAGIDEDEGAKRAIVGQKLNDLLARRLELLQAIKVEQTPSSVVPTANDNVPAGSINLGTGSDAAANKLASAIDSVRLKIAQASAEFANDPLGKALAENFNRAGLSIDDFSAKAEELRALTELQVDAETRLAIATESVTAVRDADREAVAEWSKVQEEGKGIMEDLRTPTEEYAATVERLRFLLSEGAISVETFSRGLKKAKEDLEDADEKTKTFKDGVEDASHVIGTAFEDAILKGETLRGVLQGLAEDISRIILRLTVTKPLEGLLGDLLSGGISLGGSGGAGPGAGPGSEAAGSGGFLQAIGSLFGSLFGFASGGSFKVGGSGGTDSKLVRFRATPGEMVNVTRPGQSNGGGVVMNVVNNINASGGTPAQNRDSAEQISFEVRRAINDIVDQRIVESKRQGGASREGVLV